MNKLTLYIALFCVLLNFCSSETYYVIDAIHKDQPDKCYHKQTEFFFSPGEFYWTNINLFKSIGSCEVLYCSAPGEYSGRSCSKDLLPQCKKLGVDLTKQHPFCCPRFLCTNENGQWYMVNPSVPTRN